MVGRVNASQSGCHMFESRLVTLCLVVGYDDFNRK